MVSADKPTSGSGRKECRQWAFGQVVGMSVCHAPGIQRTRDGVQGPPDWGDRGLGHQCLRRWIQELASSSTQATDEGFRSHICKRRSDKDREAMRALMELIGNIWKVALFR